jgi:hypothetical protein
MNKENEETKKKVHFFRALLNAGFKDITNDIYPEKHYSEKELSCYTNIMKRAFKKGTYSINCDYGGAFIKVRESSEFKSFEDISDKLIALVIYLGSLKTKNSRYKFGSKYSKTFHLYLYQRYMALALLSLLSQVCQN